MTGGAGSKLAGGAADGSAIEISVLDKLFDDLHVLKDIDLTVQPGEKVVICGPCGAGKSTLIRCINALETHQSGMLRVLGRCARTTCEIREIRQDVGMVFQQFNLFPHLTGMENLTLAPRVVLDCPDEEAIERSTRVIFMDEGRIVEDCSPQRFFDAPANERVRRFLSQVDTGAAHA